MRQGPLERDIYIVINGCSGFATSIQKGPFMAMLISRSGGTYLIVRKTSKMVGYVDRQKFLLWSLLHNFKHSRTLIINSIHLWRIHIQSVALCSSKIKCDWTLSETWPRGSYSHSSTFWQWSNRSQIARMGTKGWYYLSSCICSMLGHCKVHWKSIESRLCSVYSAQ